MSTAQINLHIIDQVPDPQPRVQLLRLLHAVGKVIPSNRRTIAILLLSRKK